MNEQVVDFLYEYPLMWIPIVLLAPVAIGYRYRRFKRNMSSAKDARSKTLLVVGFVAAALIIWAFLKYT